MFQAIPRMKFEQFTTSSPTNRTLENVLNENNNDGRSRSKTVWIPQGYQMVIAFWTLAFLLFTSTTACSIVMGLNRKILHGENGTFMKKNKAFLYANGFFYGIFWVNCTLVFFILIYYGRNLLRMTEESYELTGIQDVRNRNVSDRIKRRLEDATTTFKAYIYRVLEKVFSSM